MTPSCQLPVKVIPNAPRTAVAGWLGDALKVRIQGLDLATVRQRLAAAENP